MKVRFDVILEFEDGIDKDEYDNLMVEIYNDMFNVAIDVDVINEKIID